MAKRTNGACQIQDHMIIAKTLPADMTVSLMGHSEPRPRPSRFQVACVSALRRRRGLTTPAWRAARRFSTA
ncbi:hypothetical protein HPB47_025185 [Ixodes persulcatus]|uniref:Uncharacterized protein n=1 Tax=Ixodes persulcatus TaxID=34615 RepID=A0AC60Q293_IXOPE|nr:hypothetical protein HPB47_025185 [Ixodes persulcatus]